jgi:hypothetical protein
MGKDPHLTFARDHQKKINLPANPSMWLAQNYLEWHQNHKILYS